MRTLIIGGTRNLGHFLVLDLLAAGHAVTVLNRGIHPDELPGAVDRLHADRTDPVQLADALLGREFDLVVDTTLYNGAEARSAVELLEGRVGRYLFISTGQVYLVREGARRPSREEDYEGPLLPAPAPGTADHDGWRYGIEKREAEDVFTAAARERRFPYHALRLPMVHSERDHYERIANYLARLRDGGPIVVPTEGNLSIRHVYAADVALAVRALAAGGFEPGRAYNISQDETLTLDEFLELLAGLAGRPLRVARVPRAELEGRGLLPAASPFSGRWMSALDNARSRDELGMRYTPMAEYLAKLVGHHEARPTERPAGYARRDEELALARQFAGS